MRGTIGYCENCNHDLYTGDHLVCHEEGSLKLGNVYWFCSEFCKKEYLDKQESEKTGPSAKDYQIIYSWKKILFAPMKTKRYWRQFAIYTVTSVAGMFCTRYIPAEYWPYWFAFSLFIGHLINLFNYAGFKINWKRKKK